MLGPPRLEYTDSTTNKSITAGRSRLARRNQKDRSPMVPRPSHSPTNSPVIRNPESTKKKSTPR